jgi:3,4-dihydroxy 2-butanone 4-phosphate synthase/GTP cyclohydrolase II
MPMEGKDLDRLGVPAMVERNTDNHETAFTVSVDHKDTTTGISAFERAQTIQGLTDGQAGPDDFRRPGHIFPLRARDGGVLKRTGHTEAAVDLARLAGLKPAGVICEILSEDGTMARTPELMEFAEKHGIRS